MLKLHVSLVFGGELYQMSLKNLKELCKCYYPLSVLAMSWILMTNCVWHDLLLLKPC
jgi:hypothetical protein